MNQFFPFIFHYIQNKICLVVVFTASKSIVLYSLKQCIFEFLFSGRQFKKGRNTHSCDPLLLVLLSSSGIPNPLGPVSGLGGLAGSVWGLLKDALRPMLDWVTVLKAGTEKTSYAEARLGMGAGSPKPVSVVGTPATAGLTSSS